MTPEPETTEAPAEQAEATTTQPNGFTAEDRKALEAVVAKERAATKAEAKKARDAQAQLDKLSEASQSETEKAIAQARKEAAAEVASTYQKRILNAEIRAQAAQKFANPALAPRLLEVDAGAVFDDDGELDTKVIAAAIDDFLKQDENAGLRADQSGRPVGDADAGKGFGGDVKTLEQQHQEFIAGVLTGRAPTR